MEVVACVCMSGINIENLRKKTYFVHLSIKTASFEVLKRTVSRNTHLQFPSVTDSDSQRKADLRAVNMWCIVSLLSLII